MAYPGRPRKCDRRVEHIFIDIEKKRNDKVIGILFEVGIDSPDGDGRTCLIHSAAYNNIELLQWLVRNRANINHQDRIGYTALHFAGQNKYVNIAQYLLENGANPNIVDTHGNSPLWTAIFNSIDEKGVVNLLLKHGADPSLLNKYGESPKSLYQNIYGVELKTLSPFPN